MGDQVNHSPDIVVVGGGIIGMACAHTAAQAGARVTLIEAADAIGTGASAARAGLLTTVAEGRVGSPYARFSQNGLACILARLPELEAATGLSAGLERSAHLRLASDTKETALLENYMQLNVLRQDGEVLQDAESIGQNRRWLSPGVLCGVTGGYACHINPKAFLNVLATQFLACGGNIETSQTVSHLIEANGGVTGVQLRDGRKVLAEQTILAAGLGSLDLLNGLSAAALTPLHGVRGQMVVLDGSSQNHVLPTEVISTARGYIVPKKDGRIVVGATHEAGKTGRHLTLAGTAMLMKIASVVPALTSLPVMDTFVGIRPMTIDGLPLIGKVPGLDEVCLATGHGSHGILLSLVTADAVLRLIKGQSADKDIAAFAPKRIVQLDPEKTSSNTKKVLT